MCKRAAVAESTSGPFVMSALVRNAVRQVRREASLCDTEALADWLRSKSFHFDPSMRLLQVRYG
jgi:hypothetical protein